MTPDHDIERVLDRWFTEGPTQMPDRFLDDTLDRIDRAPRPRLAGLRTRLPVHGCPSSVRRRRRGRAGRGRDRCGLLIRTGAPGSRRRPEPATLPASLQAQWRPVGTRVSTRRLSGA